MLAALVFASLLTPPPGRQVPAAAPSASAKTNPTPVAAADLRDVRVLWMYVPELREFVFQEENPTGAVKEIRVVDPSGRVLAAAIVRAASAGEPRVCGHPAMAPAVVAAVPVDSALHEELRRQLTQPNRVHVRGETGNWLAVQALDWTKLAGGPCWN